MRVDGTRRGRARQASKTRQAQGEARQAGQNEVRYGEQTERAVRASSYKIWRYPSGTHQNRAVSGADLCCAVRLCR